MFKRQIFTILALITLFVVSVNLTYAVDTYTQLAPLPGTGNCTGSGSTLSCTVTPSATNSLGTYINGLYKLAVAAASVLAVLMIIIGGFNYVSTDAINNKEEGKETIKSALGGLLLVLASWVILYTINPQLTNLNIISTPLNSSRLSDLLLLGQAAQRAYGDALATITQGVTAANASAQTAEQQATTLRDLLTTYQTLQSQQQNAATGNGSFGSEEQAQLATLQQQIDQMGGVSGLQSTIGQLSSNAATLRTSEAARTFADMRVADSTSTTDWALLIGQATQVKDHQTASQSALNSYVANNTLNQADATTMINNIKTYNNNAISRICSKIPQTYPVIPGSPISGNTNPNYGACMANLIP